MTTPSTLGSPSILPYQDPLIRCNPEGVEEEHYAWFLNLALLRDALKETDNPKTKSIIHFLINNYLDKCSTYGLSKIKSLIGPERFNESYQITPHEPVLYYRTSFLNDRFCQMDSFYSQNIAQAAMSPLILLETDNIIPFLQLYYHTVEAKDGNWTDGFLPLFSKWTAALGINPLPRVSKPQTINQTPSGVSATENSQTTRQTTIRLLTSNSSLFSANLPRNVIPNGILQMFRQNVPRLLNSNGQTTPQPSIRALATNSIIDSILELGQRLADPLPSSDTQMPLPSQDRLSAPITLNTEENLAIPYKVTIISKVLNSEEEFFPYSLKSEKEFPYILIDFTPILSPYIKTEGNPDRERLLSEKLSEIQAILLQTIEKGLESRFTDKRWRTHFLSEAMKMVKEFVVGIVRVRLETEQGETFGGLKILPLLKEVTDRKNLCTSYKRIVSFLEKSGLTLGQIKRQKYVAQDFNLRTDVSYAVSGRNSLFFETHQEFLSLSLFHRISGKLEAVKLEKPHLFVLGKPTLRIITDLLHIWKYSDWDSWNQDPAIRMVLQTSLYKTKELLANLEISLHQNDFTRFSLCIELIHCELTALLEISSPFTKDDFSKIYKEKLIESNILPQELIPLTRAGLSRHGMTVFFSLVSALHRHNPSAFFCRGTGTYFETEHILRCNIEAAFKDPSIEKLHFYISQIGPSIKKAIVARYKGDTTLDNIRRILRLNSKSATPLLVLIDSTLENFESPKIKEIFTTFCDEIQSGSLCLVIYHSGQKFDLLGQDNYLGSPFYIVNNSGSNWNFLEPIFSDEALQADSLSHQWFCLAYKDPLAIDRYQNLIHHNIQSVLKELPENLKYDENNVLPEQIFIAEFDEDTIPSFIAITVKGGNHRDEAMQIYGLFHQICAKHGVKTFQKYSFGYNHHNIINIGDTDCSVLRITPGLNPEELLAIRDYLEKLSLLEADRRRKIELDTSSLIDLSTITIPPSQVVDLNGFYGEIYSPMPDAVIEKIKGKSWKIGAPVPLEDLAYLRVNHYDLQGKVISGEIIYHKNLAPDLLELFQELFEAKYPIEKMLLPDNYESNDNLSMKDNNSYAFCFRNMTGNPNSLSKHSFGCAIDLNPRLNPYIKNGVVYPASAEPYTDRTQMVPGLIQKGDACYNIFIKHGYIWGGDWETRDYHHFEKIDMSFLTKKNIT